MSHQRLLVALTIVNLVLLALSLARPGATVAASQVLRGRGLEIVDAKGDQIIAERQNVSLRLTNHDGAEQVVRPGVHTRTRPER